MPSKLQPLRTPPQHGKEAAAADISAEARLGQIIASLPEAAVVVDYGCYGWQVARLGMQLGRHDLRQIGIDLNEEPPERPSHAEFRLLSAMGRELPALDADLIVATHVLEHCIDAVSVFGTLIAAVKPQSCVYIETPSERTALLPSDPDVENQGFTSFWDDPTHVRPWPLAALYRLGLSWGARPEDLRHADRDGIHCSTGLIRRVDPLPPRYRYVSLADVPRGVDAALRHVNRRAQTPD